MRKESSLVAYRNNAAALLVEGGNYQEAIACLSTVIMEFSPGCPDDGCDGHCCSEETDCLEAANVMSLDQCMIYNQESFKEDGKPYLYKNPIRIPRELKERCCKNCHDNLLSTIMVFNLALSYHLQALHYSTNTTDRDLCLQKAVLLYELTFDIQKRVHFDSNYTFVLAVVNNLAMIHRMLKNEALANMGFQRMLSILMYLVHTGKNGQCGELEGFQYNVSLGTSQTAEENTAGAA